MNDPTKTVLSTTTTTYYDMILPVDVAVVPVVDISNGEIPYTTVKYTNMVTTGGENGLVFERIADGRVSNVGLNKNVASADGAS
jgi:hypothetical protein